LDDVHFVLSHAERFQQPQTHVGEYEQRDHRASWLELFDRLSFRVHFQAVYDQNALSGRFDYGKHLNAKRERFDFVLDATVANGNYAEKAVQIDACQADHDQELVIAHFEFVIVADLWYLSLIEMNTVIKNDKQMRISSVMSLTSTDK
jgi:hypothetical protein